MVSPFDHDAYFRAQGPPRGNLNPIEQQQLQRQPQLHEQVQPPRTTSPRSQALSAFPPGAQQKFVVSRWVNGMMYFAYYNGVLPQIPAAASSTSAQYQEEHYAPHQVAAEQEPQQYAQAMHQEAAYQQPQHPAYPHAIYQAAHQPWPPRTPSAHYQEPQRYAHAMHQEEAYQQPRHPAYPQAEYQTAHQHWPPRTPSPRYQHGSAEYSLFHARREPAPRRHAPLSTPIQFNISTQTPEHEPVGQSYDELMAELRNGEPFLGDPDSPCKGKSKRDRAAAERPRIIKRPFKHWPHNRTDEARPFPSESASGSGSESERSWTYGRPAHVSRMSGSGSESERSRTYGRPAPVSSTRSFTDRPREGPSTDSVGLEEDVMATPESITPISGYEVRRPVPIDGEEDSRLYDDFYGSSLQSVQETSKLT